MIEVVKTALIVTAFVAVMMLLVEYLNVLTGGVWQQRLAEHVWGQYLLAGGLGLIPGCLGAFAVVSMYSHGVLTLGAVVTAMVATSGDEAFVLLAVAPRQVPVLMAVLLAAGIATGLLVDLIGGKRRTRDPRACLELHTDRLETCFEPRRIVSSWKECSPARGALAGALVLLLAGLLAGQLDPGEGDWVRATLIAVSGLALLMVATVPDHFLEEHLWRHVARTHVPRTFLWTLGALTAMHFLTKYLSLREAIRQDVWLVLLIACLVGLIPESGPHLIFVTLYAQGMVPPSVLLASSIVQDGHGMLPMLAHSRREFVLIKSINFAAGLTLGWAALTLGF